MERPTTVLIWQIDPSVWEADWIRYLLKGLYQQEVVDKGHTKTAKRMIVIDNLLSREKEAYYRAAAEPGAVADDRKLG